MRELCVNAGGQKISALFQDGRKSAVLLIHGNSSCKEVFSKQLKALTNAGFAVVIPDLPGHGKSENAKKPRTIYSFPGYAHILTHLMSELNIAQYHVVGWSLGGHVGLELWYGQPGVKSLLITGTPPIQLSAFGASRGFIPSPTMDLAGKNDFTPSEADAYGKAMLGSSLDRRQRVGRAIARTHGKARYWMLRNGLAGHGIDEAAAVQKCRRPLAVVQGLRDPFVNIDYLRQLAYSNIWLNNPIFLDTGHAPHWTKPRLFNKLLIKFLQEIN
jgi:pimeloyl-ACP methyl ester carboxylesterase